MNGGRIAVLRSTAAWPADEPATPTTQPTVGIYSTRGKLLQRIVLSTPIPPPPPPNPDSCGCYPSTIFNSAALSGNRLVALTETAPQDGSGATKIEVYERTKGALLRTWPVALKVWATNVAPALTAYGQLAAVEGKRLQVLDLTTGKVVLSPPASGNGSPAAMGPHGLVYATPGKLVFVPIATLLGLTSH